MAKRLVIGNWKMNPQSFSESKNLFSAVKKSSLALKRTRVVICPPSVFLSSLAGQKQKTVFLGAQDVFWQKSGAHTGEISASMLKNLGLAYCIVGHSERRALGESDLQVSKKAVALSRVKIMPIVCIGERERDAHGHYLEFLRNQIKHSLAGLSKKEIERVIIAYEPIWAIGKSASDAINSHKLHEIVIFVRKTISELWGRQSGASVTIIYGGSVEPKNASDLITDGNVSGFLVGHTSLDHKNFLEIIKIAENAK